jgi:hypothetical protein
MGMVMPLPARCGYIKDHAYNQYSIRIYFKKSHGYLVTKWKKMTVAPYRVADSYDISILQDKP